jgi:hypothetical protein
MVRLNALIAAFVLLIAASAMRAGAAPVAARGTSVQGNAWTADNAPIPHARLRLRNVSNGKIEATAIANEAGQFMFTRIEPGTYLVELVSESASVLAVGQVFTIGADQTVATFVRLGSRARGVLGFLENAAAGAITGAAFFDNAATAVSAAAGSLGITAVTPTSRPASAGR